jgi:hypothetical protein
MQSRSPYSQFALGLVYTLQGHDSATSRLQVGAVPRTAGCLDIEGPGLVADSPTALEHRGRRGRSEPAAADCPGELEGLRHPPGGGPAKGRAALHPRLAGMRVTVSSARSNWSLTQHRVNLDAG